MYYDSYTHQKVQVILFKKCFKILSQIDVKNC